ncbi:hypothetical protein BC332_10649 [Capsicum chinense]|nr:hypothetical protein BC332_10649 [Capsicum chinense]
MVGPSSASTSLKEYLKKYESNNSEEEKKKQKKKKKVKPNVKSVGVVVVDKDPVWQKPVKIEDEEDESADEELPQVNEDIEVKRMKRLEQLRARRPFGSVSEDGSGWVSVSSTSNNVISDEQVSDLSPPRKRLGRNDSPSPEPQLNPSSSGADYLSPPRKPRARNDTPSPESGPNQPRTQEGDLSPPRKRSARNDLPRARIHSPSPESQLKPSSSRDADLSPPQSKARSSADLSPPRRRQKHGQSLLDTSDVSPPRRGSRAQGDSRVDQPTDLSPLRKARPASSTMKQGPKTGLVSGKDIKEEIDRTKKEDWLRFQEMDPLVSGRNAEPVYRDKITGQRMSKEEFLKSKKKKEEKEKPKEIKLEWGKGLAQKREMEVRLQELESEKDKPFARTRDDPELDTMLKERVRWGDPMAHLVKKKQLDPILPDFGANEKMKDSGFIIPQVIPSHSWIKRGLDAAPNRYGIRPGRHWDGVDRSTGYEKDLFKRMNEKQATEREAYLWSVSDINYISTANHIPSVFPPSGSGEGRVVCRPYHYLRKSVEARPKIKWGSLTLASAFEMEEKLKSTGAWGSRGGVDSTWETTASCIRETAIEVLGVSRGRFGKHRGDWWWNQEVKGKVESKKVTYASWLRARMMRKGRRIRRSIRNGLAGNSFSGTKCTKRRTSKSTYISSGDKYVRRNVSPFSKSEHRRLPNISRNVSPFSKSEYRRRHESHDTVYNNVHQMDKQCLLNWKPYNNDVAVIAKPNYLFTILPRIGPEQKSRDPHSRLGEKEDIFRRKECSAVTITQNGKFGSMPQASTDRNVSVFNKINQNGTGIVSSGTIVTRTRIMNSSSAVSRQSSNLTDATGRTSRSTKKFIANRQIKSQKEAWFSCIKKGSCGNSRKDGSPERGGPMDEALLIEKAFVVEMLIQFWADKYQPASLKRFICHKQQALQLNHLGSAFQIDFNPLLKDFCGDCFRHRKQVLAT